MADQSIAVAGFGDIVYQPGNSLFPTLPGIGDPTIGKLDEFGEAVSVSFIDIPIAPPPSWERTSAAAPASGFADWYLNQIWITPDPVNFGDIADQKDIEVTFYSTHEDPKTISNIELPVDGLSIVGQGSPFTPIVVNPFSDQTEIFRAAQEGPQSFDADAIVTIDGIGDVDLRQIGRRVLLLFGEPEAGFVENIRFATNLMRSKDGTEQAFSLRRAPYSIINYLFRLGSTNDTKRTELETILMAGAPTLPIGVQYWWEARKITSAATASDTVINIDTSNMQINIGDTICFTTPSNVNITAEVLSFTVSTVTLTDVIGTALPENTYGMPVRFGHTERDTSLTTYMKNLEDLAVSVRTEAEVDIGEVDANYFDFNTNESPARPIVRKRCIIGDTAQGTITREEQRLDSVTGRLFVTGTEPIGEWSTQLGVHIRSTAELYAWRKFLHYVRGSWGKFYLPTFQNDLPLESPFSMGGNTFTIPEMGIAKLIGLNQFPKRDLRIVPVDGNVYYRRITGVVDNGNGTETITLSGVVGSGSPTFSQPDETVISWMHLVRVAGDSAQFNHRLIGEADLIFRVRTAIE